mmetsp:Transcript_26725/g.66119  ORF Transcript_26725/g.66119 Transcript_26725/m.66119 type:complete len:80 (-) Transcript_26725:369-608(-)
MVDLDAPKFEASASTGVGWLSLTVRDFSLLVRSGRAPLFVRADGSGLSSFTDDRCGVDLICCADDRCGVDLICCATDCR